MIVARALFRLLFCNRVIYQRFLPQPSILSLSYNGAGIPMLLTSPLTCYIYDDLSEHADSLSAE